MEYDAYRSELEAGGGAAGGGATGGGAAGGSTLAADTQRLWQQHERLRQDSAVKLQLLHQNRVGAALHSYALL